MKSLAVILLFTGFALGQGTSQNNFNNPVIVAKSINGTPMADQFSAADACASINAAEAVLPSTGGTIDARAFQGAQTACASNIVLNKPTTLLLGASSISSSTDPVISITSSGVSIICEPQQQCSITQNVVNQNGIKIAAGLSNVHLAGLTISATANFATETLMETNLTAGNPVWGAGTTGSHIVGVVIEKCLINNGNNGIILQYTDRSRVVNNRFETPAQTNPGLAQLFFVGTSAFNTIADNAFNDTLGIANAVYIRGDGTANQSPFQNAVIGNTMNGIYQFEGININGAYHTVSGNALKNSSNATNAAGIVVFEPVNGAQADTASTAHHNTITGNTIQMLGANHNEAIILVDNGSTGDLGANDNIISSNVISAISGHGIGVGANLLGGTHVGGNRNTISNNRVDTAQNAMDCINLFNSLYTNVTGNQCFTTAASPGNGINLANSKFTQITGGYIRSFNTGIFSNGSIATNAGICGVFFDSVGNAIAPNASTTGLEVCPGGNYFFTGGTAYQLNSNTVLGIPLRVTADFTTASSTALQAIPAFTFTTLASLPMSYEISCHLAYSQATNVADAFGIQAATFAPNNVYATMLVQTNGTTAYTGSTLATLATTTATNIGTFTPTSAGVQTADIYATVEVGNNASPETVNIMVSQSTAADVIVIKRGSFCTVAY